MKETWNPAEISEDIKPVNYVNADTWNAAELNEAIDLFGIKYPVDTWNPAELDEKARNVINDITSTKTITGNPISFKTINGGYAKSCEVTFSPIQDLHGQSAPYPAGGGNNKWNEDWEPGYIKNNDGQNFDSQNHIRSKTFSVCESSTEYRFIKPEGQWFGVFWYASDNSYIDFSVFAMDEQKVITSPSNAKKFRICTGGSSTPVTTYSGGIACNYPSSVTTYSPYANICPISGRDSLHLYQDTEQTETPETTYTATFPSTVYGGEYEFVEGKVKSEWGYIASYNGETITEPWMSDRDVYVEGTTPSIGAEVCYKLATPTEITLTPETIELLKGNNVFWTDGDSIELKYTKLTLPDDSEGLSLNQKVRKAIEIIKGKAINEELKEETKKSTTKGRRKKS